MDINHYYLFEDLMDFLELDVDSNSRYFDRKILECTDEELDFIIDELINKCKEDE